MFTYSVSNGIAVCTVSDGQSSYSMWASYIYPDTLRDLLMALNALLSGAKWARCVWQDEPGEYRWIMTRMDHQVEIRIVTFMRNYSHRRDDEGELEFTTVMGLREFAEIVRNEIQRMIDNVGRDGYHREWRGPFPEHDFDRLCQLLA